MKHNNPPQFYLTMETDCPYLPGQKERKVFTHLFERSGQGIQNSLSEIGFRRSQNIIYRPACANCTKCLSARVVVKEFQPSKTQKRILKLNQNITREIRKCHPTEEQYELFSRYVNSRHLFGGMANMSLYEYGEMVSETSVASRLIEYRMQDDLGRPGELVGCVLTDVIGDGVSMVYSFFEPEYEKRSLGVFMVLDHIGICNEASLNYVYLGYWVKNSASMDYKRNFKPLELFYGNNWNRAINFESIEPTLEDAHSILLQAHQQISNNRKKTDFDL